MIESSYDNSVYHLHSNMDRLKEAIINNAITYTSIFTFQYG